MECENPNYFGIITADVRYSKELTANAKLLFAEISALSNKFGYCFASNNYFAELYQVTPQAISKWVNQLAKCGFIFLEYKYGKDKEITERRIYLQKNKTEVSTNNDRVSTDIDGGINKCLQGYQQKIKGNNKQLIINNNNISLSEYEAIKKENEELKKQLANASSSKDSEKKTTDKKRYPKADYDEVYALHNKICKWLCDNNKLSSMPTYSYKVCNSVIKKAFDSFGKDKVLEGMKNAVKDRWCVENSCFCITAILSEKVLFREINKQYFDPYKSNNHIEIKKGQSAFVDKERDFSNINNSEDIK